MARAVAPGFDAVTGALLDASWYAKPRGGDDGAIQRQTNMQVLYGMLRLAFDVEADVDVRALALDAVRQLDTWLGKRSSREPVWQAHYRFARAEIARLRDDPQLIHGIAPAAAPPGSPIGSINN